ncbi:hypothetical protein [Marinospirillum sp.]|uniref:hypothetical protein n=1 Tax=Marinospirillum sp. TaxID=2183934 RepID=UPI0028700A2C|nr:hypothetical protein [Marinospirillum sp.]MDR9468880.1 hypothetical protein [Marinospirillum sp.]
MRFLIFTLLSLLAFSVSAANLSDSEVQRWIDTHPQIQAWLDQHEDLFPEEDEDAMSFNMEQIFAEGIEELRKAGLYDEFNSQIQDAGFNNVEHWTEITQNITLAYMALAMEDSPHSRQMLERQIEEIRTSPNIPEDQREMYEAMMVSSLEMIDMAEQVPDADKETVRPHLPQLEEMFEVEPGY